MRYSIATGIQKLSMPLLNVKINNIKLTFLIDFGATYNIVASFVYNQLKDNFTLIDEENKVMGVDGVYQETSEVETIIEIDDKKFQTRFSVVNMDETVIKIQEESGLQLHGFLGIPFLMDNKCVLDFKTQEIIID